MFRARKVGWGFVSRLHGSSKMANQTKCGLICWKIRDDVLPPPREASATLPAAPCFPRFLGKHARLGMSRAEPSARLLPAAPCHSRLPGNFWPPPAIPSPERVAAPSFLRFPIPGENTNRGVAGFDCFPGCCRQLLPPWLLPPTAAASCCRSFCAEICDIGDRRRWSKF